MPSKSLKSPAGSSAKSATKSSTKSSSKSRTLSKKKIFSTALALVDEKGLSSLSLRALGQRLGVSQAVFYRHVPNKSALLHLPSLSKQQQSHVVGHTSQKKR